MNATQLEVELLMDAARIAGKMVYVAPGVENQWAFAKKVCVRHRRVIEWKAAELAGWGNCDEGLRY